MNYLDSAETDVSNAVITAGGRSNHSGFMSVKEIIGQLDANGSGQISTEQLELLLEDTHVYKKNDSVSDISTQGTEFVSNSASAKVANSAWWSWHTEVYRLQHGNAINSWKLNMRLHNMKSRYYYWGAFLFHGCYLVTDFILLLDICAINLLYWRPRSSEGKIFLCPRLSRALLHALIKVNFKVIGMTGLRLLLMSR